MRRWVAGAVGCVAFAGAPSAQVRELWVPAVDYPAGIAPGAAEYRVRVRYQLSPDGRVARCTVERGSGQPLLDAESCRILQARARIRPDPGARRGQIQFVWMDVSSLERPFQRGGPLSYGLYQNITADDYPAEALERAQSGTTEFAVDVSATGRPTACRVVRSSGSALLDERTCALVMTRSAFVPAADGAGTAYGRITWRMP